MVAIKLREAMQAYKRRTGQRMTYEILAEHSGIAQGTLEVMGSMAPYNATIGTLEKICLALDVPIQEMLEIIPDPPKSKRVKKKARKR